MNDTDKYCAVVRKTAKGFLTKAEMDEAIAILDAEEFIPVCFFNEYMGFIAPKRLKNNSIVEVQDMVEDMKEFTLHVGSPSVQWTLKMIRQFNDGEVTKDGRGINYPYGHARYCILYDDTLENLAKSGKW